MRVIALAAVLVSLPSTAAPQTAPAPTADRQQPAVQWLLLQRAYLDLRDAEQKNGADASTPDRREASRLDLERARLEYGAVLASFVPLVPRLVVTSAVKRQAPGGPPTVQLRLRSQPIDWPDAHGRLSFAAVDADLASLRTIRSALVAIKNGDGIVIGRPFQATIDVLQPGEQTTVTFQLQDAASPIVVALHYAGRVDEYSIRLAAEGSPLRLDSAQVSQDADLGSTVTYDLRIERTTAQVRMLRLQAIGLPASFRHEFLLDAKPAPVRLSQYRFRDDELVRPIMLRLQLPEALSDSTTLDAPIRFRARALDGSVDAAGAGLAADAELEVVPRGVGRVTLQMPNFLVEGTEGAAIAARVEAKNAGTRDVRDIKPAIDVPTGWSASVRPSTIAALRANETQSLDVVLQPGAARAGDYTAKVRVAASDASRESNATADLRVRLVARSSVGGMVGFFGGLLGLVAAVTFVGARLARR